MSVTNINANSELTIPLELQATTHERLNLRHDDDSIWVIGPRSVLQSALAALSDGRITEVVAQFAERFKFNDHALALEFIAKARLTAFLEKSRELFPDAKLEIMSVFGEEDHATAEWKLAATQTISYGSIICRVPISLRGSTIVQVEHGRIVQWSDYYDQATSRRIGLAAFFTEWIEY